MKVCFICRDKKVLVYYTVALCSYIVSAGFGFSRAFALVDVSVATFLLFCLLFLSLIAIVNKAVSCEIVNIVWLTKGSIKKGFILGKRIKINKITNILIDGNLQINAGRKTIKLINYPSDNNRAAYVKILEGLSSKRTVKIKTLLKRIDDGVLYCEHILNRNQLPRPLRIILIYMILSFLAVIQKNTQSKPFNFSPEVIAASFLAFLLVLIIICIIKKKHMIKWFVLMFFIAAEAAIIIPLLIASFDFISLSASLLFTLFTALGIYRYFKISRAINLIYVK